MKGASRTVLQSFPSVSSQLLDTKSTDRKLTLLHYIANVVKEKYAQVSLFYNELHYVEKAAAGGCSVVVGGGLGRRRLCLKPPLVPAVSLENVLMDVRELNRGMELTRREYSMHGHNTMLKEFIGHNESKLKKLQDDAKIAQVRRPRPTFPRPHPPTPQTLVLKPPPSATVNRTPSMKR